MKALLLYIAILVSGCLAGCSPLGYAASAIQETQPVVTAGQVSPAATPATRQPSASPTAEQLPDLPPSSCPVSAPQQPVFQPPAPYSPESPYPGEFWYGSNDLWTLLPNDGRWAELPYDKNGYFQKVVWWREGYHMEDEPQPKLYVSGRRLDAEAPSLKALPATNGFHPDVGDFMLTGVEIPTPGCWEISGEYYGSTLTFVVWVAPGT